MDKKDARRLLGVSDTASARDVEVCYRTLAKTMHPDAGGRTEDFQNLLTAYDLLKASASSALLPDEIRPVTIDLATAVYGGVVTVETMAGPCHTCDGSGHLGGRRDCPECSGEGSTVRSYRNVRLAVACESCSGRGWTRRQCPSCSGMGTVKGAASVPLTIPPATQDGDVLAVGRPAGGDGSSVRVVICAHRRFTQDGFNLVMRLDAPYAYLCLGGTVVVKDLLGAKHQIAIPPRSRVGKKFLIPGRGVPMPSGGSGHLVVVLGVQIPERIDVGSEKLLRAFEASLVDGARKS